MLSWPLVFVPMSYFRTIKSRLKMTIILLSLVDSVSHGFGRGAPWAVQGLSVVVRWRLELGRLGVGGASFSVDRELLRVVSLAGLLGLPHSMAAQGARVSVLRHGRFSRALSPYSIGDRSATGLPRFTGKGIRFQFLVGGRKVPEELLGWKMLPPSWQVQSSGLAWGKPATLLWPTCSPSI